MASNDELAERFARVAFQAADNLKHLAPLADKPDHGEHIDAAVARNLVVHHLAQGCAMAYSHQFDVVEILASLGFECIINPLDDHKSADAIDEELEQLMNPEQES